MKKLATLILLFAVSPLWSASVTLPSTMSCQKGRLIRITATTDGKVVRWINGSLDADLIPMESGLSAIFSSPNPGRYLIYAYTAAGDIPSEAAQCVVVVGDPGPGPGPGPTPPSPPTPPEPADPLVGKLTVAWGLEEDTQRDKLKDTLATFYKQGAVLVTDPSLKTWGDVFKQMGTASMTLGLRGKLPNVQKALAGELDSKLPTTSATVLDAAGRQLAAKTFLNIAAALEKIK